MVCEKVLKKLKMNFWTIFNKSHQYCDIHCLLKYEFNAKFQHQKYIISKVILDMKFRFNYI